jgi:hypothetical protein
MPMISPTRKEGHRQDMGEIAPQRKDRSDRSIQRAPMDEPTAGAPAIPFKILRNQRE